MSYWQGVLIGYGFSCAVVLVSLAAAVRSFIEHHERDDVCIVAACFGGVLVASMIAPFASADLTAGMPLLHMLGVMCVIHCLMVPVFGAAFLSWYLAAVYAGVMHFFKLPQGQEE